jgi:hypothetical protein
MLYAMLTGILDLRFRLVAALQLFLLNFSFESGNSCATVANGVICVVIMMTYVDLIMSRHYGLYSFNSCHQLFNFNRCDGILITVVI